MLRNRDTALAFALIAGLAVLSVFGALAGAAAAPAPPLDSGSDAPNGASALFRWLGALGYTVSDAVTDEYAVPAGTDLVFLLEPAEMAPAEVETLASWVEDGGVLVFAGRFFGSVPLLSAFDVERRYAGDTAAALAPTLPLLTNPPVAAAVPFAADSYWDAGFDDFIPLAARPEGPVVIAFGRGSGWVVLSAATYPFTNAGLKEPGAGAFVLNLAGQAPPGGQVWFDEWHHGRRPVVRGPAGPGDWLRRTAPGRAVLYAAGTIFAWIALSGRAFGRPIKPQGERPRRAPLEFIDAIAGLNQRAGNRSALLAGYHRRLKRSLAARYRIDPALPDEEFIAALRRYEPAEDLDALTRLLADLRKPGIGEQEMIRLAAHAVDLLDNNSSSTLNLDAKTQRREENI